MRTTWQLSYFMDSSLRHNNIFITQYEQFKPGISPANLPTSRSFHIHSFARSTSKAAKGARKTTRLAPYDAKDNNILFYHVKNGIQHMVNSFGNCS